MDESTNSLDEETESKILRNRSFDRTIKLNSFNYISQKKHLKICNKIVEIKTAISKFKWIKVIFVLGNNSFSGSNFIRFILQKSFL